MAFSVPCARPELSLAAAPRPLALVVHRRPWFSLPQPRVPPRTTLSSCGRDQREKTIPLSPSTALTLTSVPILLSRSSLLLCSSFHVVPLQGAPRCRHLSSGRVHPRLCFHELSINATPLIDPPVAPLGPVHAPAVHLLLSQEPRRRPRNSGQVHPATFLASSM
jgi:hypothetical protein